MDSNPGAKSEMIVNQSFSLRVRHDKLLQMVKYYAIQAKENEPARKLLEELGETEWLPIQK